jgi:hypothetical protein
MTQGGTVVFADEQEYTWYVIDAPGLATGWMTLTEFGSNGNIRAFTLRQPWNMGQMMSFGQMLGRRALKLAMLGTGGPPQYNEPYVLLPTILAHFSTSNKNSLLVGIVWNGPSYP